MYLCTWLWCESVNICKYLWHCFMKSTCVEEERSEGVTEWCGQDIEECVRESTQ